MPILRRLSIGQKLFTSFAAMLALAAVLLAMYWLAGRAGHERLTQTFQVQNRKLAIGAQIELATTEMQGAQRGLMLSYAMRDPAASQQYVKLYGASGSTIDRDLVELQPLLANSVESAAAQHIQENRATWEPRFRKLIGLCEAGSLAEAYRLRNENKLISAQMHAAATELVTEQKKAIELMERASERDQGRFNWVAALVALVALALGGTVLRVVRGIARALQRVVDQLRDNAAELARSSAQVSRSSQALAQGVTEQAASTEETSASAEEIAAMTAQNLDHVSHAHGVIERNIAVIDHANGFLIQMEESMQQIAGACQKMSGVIKAIDEIAFQTNILALNAAVESARAGAAGLGFGVVADEVRNLARRSAEAARETAELIEQSIGRSHDGCTTLSKVADSMREVTAGAREISTLVAQVNIASTEQSRGLGQIAQAMSQIGRVTQSAAAGAQETASVGKEMSAQADALHSVVRTLHDMVG